MKKIIKYCIIACTTVCTLIFMIYGYQIYLQTMWEVMMNSYWLIIPAVALYLLILGRRLGFIENLMHELTHMLFSFLTFSKVSGLYVSETNGIIYTEGSEKSIMVTLSPYFFPLLTAVLLGLFSIIDFSYEKYVLVVTYVLFLVIAIKHLINVPYEITSTGFMGWLLLLILNFWMSFFILSACSSYAFNYNEILSVIYYGIKNTVSQIQLI